MCASYSFDEALHVTYKVACMVLPFVQGGVPDASSSDDATIERGDGKETAPHFATAEGETGDWAAANDPVSSVDNWSCLFFSESGGGGVRR